MLSFHKISPKEATVPTNRRSFLHSALFLPSALAASAFAQDNKTALSFADFESGAWGDWTTEGEAFGSAPATEALFPGRIQRFGGRGFVCTLHPRKGNAAVGKAVSREFTIEKPFISFRIGGGNFPYNVAGNVSGQACLNLVIDSQVVRTATGNGSPILSNVSWDVSALVGKKARLEIIDNTRSEQRGYVLVDDIIFTNIDNSLIEKSLPMIGDSYFVSSRALSNTLTTISTDYARDERIKNPESIYGVSIGQLEANCHQIGMRMIAANMDHDASLSVNELGQKISKAVTEVLNRLKVSPDSMQGQYLFARGLCDWVRTHLQFNAALAPIDLSIEKWEYRVPSAVMQRFWKSSLLLQEPRLLAICAGFATLTSDLSNAMGLDGKQVGGYTRWTRNTFGPKRNHVWMVFRFTNPAGEAFFCPADPTRARINIDRARKAGKVPPNPFLLPIHLTEWGVFIWQQQASQMEGGQKFEADYGLTKLTLNEWKSIGAIPELERLELERVVGRVLVESQYSTVNIIPK